MLQSMGSQRVGNRAGGSGEGLPPPHSSLSGGGLAAPGRESSAGSASWAAGPARSATAPASAALSWLSRGSFLREKNHHQPRSASTPGRARGKSERNWIVILEARSNYTCGKRRARGSRESRRGLLMAQEGQPRPWPLEGAALPLGTRRPVTHAVGLGRRAQLPNPSATATETCIAMLPIHGLLPAVASFVAEHRL